MLHVTRLMLPLLMIPLLLRSCGALRYCYYMPLLLRLCLN